MKSLQIWSRRVRWGLRSYPSLRQFLGLNPGELLEKEISAILSKQGVGTVALLRERVAKLPAGGLHTWKSAQGFETKPFTLPEDKKPRLALIASEISTGTKVIFPRMAEFISDKPEELDPAYFVRASMSVPFFFKPLNLSVPQVAYEKWKARGLVGDEAETSDTSGESPKPDTTCRSCSLVDGGIMSNFPISEFHSFAPPNTPTFGAKLGLERTKLEKIDGEPITRHGVWKLLPPSYKAGPLGKLGLAVFNSARETLDEDFINNNPDYEKLITRINTGPHSWLNFKLSAADQVDLFLRGVAAGAVFLKHFNWEEYRAVRQQIFQAQIVGVEERVGNGAGNGDGAREEEEDTSRGTPMIPDRRGEPASHV
jgi:NTE family protein